MGKKIVLYFCLRYLFATTTKFWDDFFTIVEKKQPAGRDNQLGITPPLMFCGFIVFYIKIKNPNFWHFRNRDNQDRSKGQAQKVNKPWRNQAECLRISVAAMKKEGLKKECLWEEGSATYKQLFSNTLFTLFTIVMKNANVHWIFHRGWGGWELKPSGCWSAFHSFKAAVRENKDVEWQVS